MKILIMGASSGLGAELVRRYVAAGNTVAAAARREDRIPPCAATAAIDVDSPSAPDAINALIDRLGGLDLYVHVAGIGYADPALDPAREAQIAETDAVGFARCVSAVFNRMAADRRPARIAAITSVAGTRGTAGMEAYCASKRFDWTYLQGLRQRAVNQHLPISITDIRPGWTRTALIDASKRYPLLMDPEKATAAIMRAIARRRKRAVIDRRWAVLQFFWSLVPDFIWRHIDPAPFAGD